MQDGNCLLRDVFRTFGQLVLCFFFCVSLGMDKNSVQTKMGCHGDLMVFHLGFNGDLL